MTIWELAAIPGDLLLLSCAAWALVCAGAWALRQPAKRRTGDQPVPGADQALANVKPPVPGHDPRAAIPRHESGGLAYAVKGWHCGCEIQFDAHGAVVFSWPCTASRPNFDDWLKGLTS